MYMYNIYVYNIHNCIYNTYNYILDIMILLSLESRLIETSTISKNKSKADAFYLTFYLACTVSPLFTSTCFMHVKRIFAYLVL